MTAKRFPVDASHISMFAWAIGDLNPAYIDGESPEAKAAGGVIAPPTFAVCSSQFDDQNPLRVVPGQKWFGSGREPAGYKREGQGLLHAEQHFEYHQPLRAGQVLIPTAYEGDTWEKASKRAGTLVFHEDGIEYRDSVTGELVQTVRRITVRPSKVVAQD
ncbi:MAG: hypothetical protein JWL70_1664 [Acidimicrobiia bacterium]|nr:hypothetical protein [Acidimicrobiia bacterium]